MIRRIFARQHAHLWTFARRLADYQHLDFDNPHRGTGRHRADD
ncbi:MAG: hypothetical protein ACTHJM_15870 [Marmoricola sp.]